jgi:adenine phosphoribosyltransferase
VSGRGAVTPGAGASEALAQRIRSVNDFPQPGIVFRDITPLLADPIGLQDTLTALASWARPLRPTVVLAPEARGFVLGGALAVALNAGFAPARKPGRLPAATVSVPYQLEYGSDALELHCDAIGAGERVLVHDDLIATGGTAAALCQLVETQGAEVVGCCFVIELRGLQGRDRLGTVPAHALISYEGD